MTKVEHTSFEPLVLERILLFMYTGDYVLPTSVQEIAANKNRNTLGAPATPSDTSVTEGASKSNAGVSGHVLLLTHVHTYFAAHYYEISDLQALASEGFRDSDPAITIEAFLHIGKAVYQGTKSDDPLRQELVYKLVNKHPEWLMERHFR